MARGSKKAYTSKQKRQAHHIEESAEKRGYSAKRAAQIGYATVNKQDKGGKKSGSGRGKARDTSSSSKGGKARRSTSSRGGSHAAHVRAGRKGGKASRGGRK
jgi:hypothetical protein